MSVDPARTRVISVVATRGPRGGSLIGKFTESTGSARHIEGIIGTARPVPSLIDSGAFTPFVDVDAGTESRRLAASNSLKRRVRSMSVHPGVTWETRRSM